MKSAIRAVIITFILINVLLLTACGASIRPSREYYVNDFAGVLLEGTRDVIILEGERLYKATKKESDSASKVVVVTLINQDEDTIAEELFASWRLGDMGILIVLEFDEEENSQKLLNVRLKIGDKMQDYISSEQLVALVQATLFSAEWEGNLNMGMGHFYYELLTRIYIDAYDYPSFEYDLEDFETYIDLGGVTKKQKPMSAISYAFSPHSPAWIKIVIIIPIILIGVGVFIVFYKKRRM